MWRNQVRRRGVLSGAVAAVASLAGCPSLQPGSEGDNPKTTTESTDAATQSSEQTTRTDTTDESSTAAVPPHTHSGEESGGASLMPETLGVTEFSQPASFTIYQRDGKTRALNGRTQEEQFTDTEAGAVIQSAIDELAPGGLVFIRAGTYRVGPDSIRPRTGTTIVGEGTGATTLKVKDGLNDAADGFYVFHVGRGIKDATIRDLEIDGNESNNRDIDPFPNSPHSHGIRIEASGGIVPTEAKPSRITVRNVSVHDTIRSNIVLTGRHCELENLWLANSATDHWLYAAGAEHCTIRGVHASGFARGGGIAVGVGERPCHHNTLAQISIEDADTTPFTDQAPGGLAGRYPRNAISFRRSGGNAHHNTVRDLRIGPSATGDGLALRILQPDTTIEGVDYRGGLGVGRIFSINPSATNTTVRDASLTLTGGQGGDVCASTAPDARFENVDIDAAQAGQSRGFVVRATEGAVARTTIRDCTVDASGAALAVSGGESGVTDLFVENVHDRGDAGVETDGTVEFIQRGIY